MPTVEEKPKPFLVPEYCKGCGRCVDVCAKGCIAFADEINPMTGLVPVVLDLANCTGCGLCIEACPEPYGLRAMAAGRDLRAAGPGQALRGQAERRPRARGHPGPAGCPCRRPSPSSSRATTPPPSGALLAGCRHFYGYPITPSTEGAELMAKLLPKLDGVFLQAVSEVATVNHMYGTGGAGLGRHDLHLRPRLLADAGGHLLHGGLRGARACS